MLCARLITLIRPVPLHCSRSPPPGRQPSGSHPRVEQDRPQVDPGFLGSISHHRLHRCCADSSHRDIVMATQQSFGDLSSGSGESPDGSGAAADADSPPPQSSLAPPPPPQHATLAALAALPQVGDPYTVIL